MGDAFRTPVRTLHEGREAMQGTKEYTDGFNSEAPVNPHQPLSWKWRRWEAGYVDSIMAGHRG